MTAWVALIDRLPFEWAHFAFMQHALLAVLLVSPLFALLGCLVISNQMAFFSEAVGHAALTGIAIGVVLGVADPTWSMMAFAVLLALSVSFLRRRSSVSPDTLIGLVMAFSVALGVVLLSRGGGFAKYSVFLIGDLLTITPAEIGRLALILLVVAGALGGVVQPLPARPSSTGHWPTAGASTSGPSRRSSPAPSRLSSPRASPGSGCWWSTRC